MTDIIGNVFDFGGWLVSVLAKCGAFMTIQHKYSEGTYITD